MSNENVMAIVNMADHDPGFEFHELIPSGVDGARVLAGFKMHVIGDPKLRECTFDSMAKAALDCARLGLWPGPQGHMHLLPFKKVMTPVVGYKGFIALIKRHTGARVEARLVHDADHFDMTMGTTPGLDHRPALRDRGECIGAYAIAFFPDGTNQFEWMDIGQINGIRDASPGYQRSDSPWRTHPGEMTRKTPTRRLAKYISMDETMGHAFAVNDRAEGYTDAPKPVRNLGGPKASPASLAHTYAPMSDEDKDAAIDAEGTPF